MPSPFPGMDPFLEGGLWEDFHTEFITGVRAVLAPSLVPRYVVRIEERIYVEYAPEDPEHLIIPDIAVAEVENALAPVTGSAATATAVVAAPVLRTVPMPQRRQEAFLTVRERTDMTVITVIEVLSPTNKRAHSDGRRKYLRKRGHVLLSPAHLVELDLLRGGERLPTREPLPPGDYYALVCREPNRPIAEVYAWTLRDPLPSLPIPLAEEDDDLILDLQAVFTAVYDRALYAYSLDYRSLTEPRLSEADAAWAQHVLASRATDTGD
jgi:Protein of unknown function (DUF4058)